MTNFKATIFTISDIILDIAAFLAAVALLIVKSANESTPVSSTEVSRITDEAIAEQIATEEAEYDDLLEQQWFLNNTPSSKVVSPRQRFTNTQIEGVALFLDSLPPKR